MRKMNLVSGSPSPLADSKAVRPLALRSLEAAALEETSKSQSELLALPTDGEIMKALERMLASQELRNKSVLKKFLSFVVDRTLSGHSDEIKGYTVATQVFARAVDFDTNIDPIVRIQAGRLRRAIERYYLNEGKDEPVRIEIPKGSYVPFFLRHSQEEQLETPSCEPSIVEGTTLALMPIANLTNDSDLDHLIDGLSQELVFELPRCNGLQVIDNRSISCLEGGAFERSRAVRATNARFILTGSARKHQQFVKLTFQLIDASTCVQLWGERFRYDLHNEEIIDILEHTAREVAGSIGGAFGVVNETLYKECRGKPVEKLLPSEGFLIFYRYLRIISKENFSRAIEAMNHVLSVDRECGPAWSMLAFLCAHNHIFRLTDTDTPLEEAMAYARKGVQLESQNQYTWFALSFFHLLLGERELCLDSARRAIRVNPNAPDIMGLAGFELALNGEWEQGLELLHKSMELNPCYPAWLHLAPSLYAYREKEYERAYGHAHRCQSPQIFVDPMLRAASLAQLGKGPQARHAIDEMLEVRPDFPTHHRTLIGYFVKEPELVETIVAGLSKAGLGLPSSSKTTFAVPKEPTRVQFQEENVHFHREEEPLS